MTTCDSCGDEVDTIGCPSGAELCQACFDENQGDTTEPLTFTRNEQNMLLAALYQIASMGLFGAKEVEDLIEKIATA